LSACYAVGDALRGGHVNVTSGGPRPGERERTGYGLGPLAAWFTVADPALGLPRNGTVPQQGLSSVIALAGMADAMGIRSRALLRRLAPDH
jgi:hypothetical protein